MLNAIEQQEKMIDMDDSRITSALRSNRAITKEKHAEAYIMGEYVQIYDCVEEKTYPVHVENFYTLLECLLLSLFSEGRKIRAMNVWTTETHNRMVCLDGGCMYLLGVLLGHGRHGEVFDMETLKAELDEVLSDEEYALDLFKEYDDCASPLGMGEWYGFHGTSPMIHIA